MRHENIIWWELFEHLRRYAESFGNANIPSDYVTPDGFGLGAWVGHVRRTYRAGLLSEEGKKALEQLPGWIWDARGAHWFEKLAYLRTYVARHGNAYVPKKYVEKNGFKLGVWLSTQRYLFRCGKLQDWKRDLLEELPSWWWDPFSYKCERQWFARLSSLIEYVKAEGYLHVPDNFVTPDGFRLGVWLRDQKYLYKNGKLSKLRRTTLEQVPGWPAQDGRLGRGNGS